LVIVLHTVKTYVYPFNYKGQWPPKQRQLGKPELRSVEF